MRQSQSCVLCHSHIVIRKCIQVTIHEYKYHCILAVNEAEQRWKEKDHIVFIGRQVSEKLKEQQLVPRDFYSLQEGKKL